MSVISSRLPRASCGGATRPEIATSPVLALDLEHPARRVEAPERAERSRRLARARRPEDGLAIVRDAEVHVRCASAMASSRRSAAASSLGAVFRNLSRAGVLKKRSCASTVVPAGAATSSFSMTVPPSPRTRVAGVRPAAGTRAP